MHSHDHDLTNTPSTTEPRPVRRSRDDRMLAGVCGGLAKYFGVDPVVVRIGAVALTAAGGAGLFVYVAAWLLMPGEGAGEGVGAGAGAMAPAV
jgi:phage shock protein C